ncbi:MAG TPA: glycosyltransferase family 4 protein [Chloroflexia bacterium]|nr:glycosyltransferase family 4 protein [Chloroflexia bacterium]
MAKTKILFFYPNEFLGPEMTVYGQIIRHLDGARFTPYLVLNSEAAGEVGLTEADGVIIRRWRFGVAFRGGIGAALRSGLQLPASLYDLVRFARREGIDIVQCSPAPRAGTLGLLLARASGARLLLHYHVIPGRYAGARGFLEALLARQGDHAVAVSRFLAGYVPQMGIPAAPIDVVVNGVDCVRFQPAVDGTAVRRELGIAPSAPLVVQLARLIPQKRQEDVVQAFALARDQVPALRGLLVGWEDPRYDGPFASYKAELRHRCATAGLGESLLIVDARPDAPQILAAADIVVMPSLGDAWNLAVTEAMAAGRPVIGAASGGIPEQIVDGETGFLVPPENPTALAARMVTLAQDPALRGSMGRAARLRAERHFDESRLASSFAPIYEGLATRPPMPSRRATGRAGV